MSLDLPISEIIAAYKGGATLNQLAAHYRCSAWSIKHRLLAVGENLRRTGPKRTYSLNEAFFSSIETEAQAYWLGFLLADGRVSKTGAGNWVCRTDLAVIDRDHLERLATAVGSNSPIKPGHDGESAYLDLCSAVLCRRLVELECGPDKTSKHGTPEVPAELQHHFYRGFSDGDGSIYEIPSISAWRFDALGSQNFISEFQHWLVRNVGVSYTKLITPANSPMSRSLRYTGGRQVARICRMLYKDATIWLPRKHEQFMSLVSRKLTTGSLLP